MLPSGEQIDIAADDQRAGIVEVGGGLRFYEVGGRAVLDGYASEAMCASGRGQVLIPWPNRLQDGSYKFDGRRHQLPVNEVDKRDAIHGLVRWSPWKVGARERDRVVMEHVLHPQPGYPFTLALEIEYVLGPGGLSVTTSATNAGKDPCPFGPTQLDDCFTDLERDEDGVARVRLQDPESGNGLTLWVDEAYGYLMLFTGDPLPDVARRSLAVEPMTCPPNAFRSGEGLIRLAPGESFSSTWGISPG